MNDTQPAMPPFICINGYPGVGKLTVAKELWYVSIQLRRLVRPSRATNTSAC